MAAILDPGRDPKRGKRRAVLGALALSLMAAPSISAGCAASFDPSSKVNGLRVLAVTPDKPYVNLEPAKADGTFPPTVVNFDMTVTDNFVDEDGDPVTRTLTIVWLGGCYDPPGDQYYLCYPQLGEVLKDLDLNHLPPEVGVDIGAASGPHKFPLTIPRDIVSQRPTPAYGPRYGIAYIFFVVCAGTIKPVPPDGTGKAPDFPLGCFDSATGKRLGADSFVPGYTQIYSFEDERTNANPEMAGLEIGDKDLPEGNDVSTILSVKACPLTDDERRAPGCDPDTPSGCEGLNLKAIVDPAVAEVDPDAKGADGEQLTEAVWISYFADRGDIAPGIKLVNDSVTGFNADLGTVWLPPAEPGVASLWAVLRDARGGSSVVQRYVLVQ